MKQGQNETTGTKKDSTIKNLNDQPNVSWNTFNKIKSTNIRLFMVNDGNSWQYVGFFIRIYKTKHNVLASLHKLTKQNTIKIGRYFSEIAK